MKTANEKRKRLRELINAPEILLCTGGYDCISARMIEQAGFQAFNSGGGFLSATLLGGPDVGLLAMTEILDVYRRMASVTNIPLIGDIDTGYGNALNVYRTVREFELAGVAGLHIEDQVDPKKCGHYKGKRVIPKEEMIMKLQAALDSRHDEDMVIIARVDSRGVHGLWDAIDRANAYRKAGADVSWVEAPVSVDEMKEIARSTDPPRLMNQVHLGKTPQLPAKELEEMGYQLMLCGAAAFQASLFAVQEFLQVLLKEGTSMPYADRMTSFEERTRIQDLPRWQELERNYTLPGGWKA
jgi:2-methylisocitrate lyase-like PEP mutase family enzyme